MARPAFVDANVLRMALIGYEQEKVRIEAAIANVRARLGDGNAAVTIAANATPRKRRLSAAARKRISAATKARWLAYRKQKAEAEKRPEKSKRKLSAAGLRAIREATAKRWAAYRRSQKGAAKKTAPNAAAKKGTPKAKVKAPGVKTAGAAVTSA